MGIPRGPAFAALCRPWVLPAGAAGQTEAPREGAHGPFAYGCVLREPDGQRIPLMGAITRADQARADKLGRGLARPSSLDQREAPLRAEWGGGCLHAQRTQRIRDGVADGGRRRDGPALAQPLQAERVAR